MRVGTPEGVRLTSAAAQWVADEVGIRVLHLKGPAAGEVLGYSRESSDVDVLVHPSDWLPYLRAMEKVGFLTQGDAVPSTGHSVDVISPHWSASVDVHHKFPGIEREAGEAFDILWGHRIALDLAGVTCSTLPKVPHALLIGLHAARSPEESVKWREADTAWRGLDNDDSVELLELVHQLGAGAALGVRFEEFSHYSTEEVRRLWAAFSRRDAEAVWWLRLRHPRSTRDLIDLFYRGVPRYLHVVHRRNDGNLWGMTKDLCAKGSRLLQAGVQELKASRRAG